MSVSFIFLIAIIVLVCGYIFYGKKLKYLFALDKSRKTPAVRLRDDIDYVPTSVPVLMGHHFASIAGAAPIIGPIAAAQFGYLPVVLWILLGSIFLGAMHDMAALVASIRHEGKSIGEVINTHLGKTGKVLFLLFSWSALVLVIAVFTAVVAKTFIARPQTATASILFILLAVLFGFFVYRRKASLVISTLIGVIFLIVSIYTGIKFPVCIHKYFFDKKIVTFLKEKKVNSEQIQKLDELIILARNHKSVHKKLQAIKSKVMTIWEILLFVYIIIASVLPVWLLLQPRDYLNSFLLYTLIVLGVVGALVSKAKINYPAYTGFFGSTGPLFPILFVTVACGAISGFHSLVASGTTAKQLKNEEHALPVGYGSMLLEALLAILAISTVMVLSKPEFLSFKKQGYDAIKIFSTGVGGFMNKLGVPLSVGIVFTALAVSAFALTSLDTATRLGRYAFEELFKGSVLQNRYIASIVTVVFAGILVFCNKWQAIWPVFGSANQLLAALALLAIFVWLKSRGKKAMFILLPMLIMFLVTLSSLVILGKNSLVGKKYVVSGIVLGLLILGTFLLVYGIKNIKSKMSKQTS